MKPLYENPRNRKIGQWVYAIATTAVLVLGWKYPILGFMVLGAMLGGMVSAILGGRWFCGNLCPRGGFLERIVSKVSPNRTPPDWLRSKWMRIAFLILLPVMLTVNVSPNPLDWRQWGHALWMVCLVTTILGLVLALFFNSRSWCAICPMGTVQNWASSGDGISLQLNSDICRKCMLCERVCPMHLKIINIDNDKVALIRSGDCIKCGECVAVCPAKALSFDSNSNQQDGKSASCMSNRFENTA